LTKLSQKPAIDPKKPLLRVRILSPTQTYYDAPAVSVTANNEVGPFDILAGHANFFSLLTAGSVSVSSGMQVFSFPISKGIMKVSNDVVALFVDSEPIYAADTAERQSVDVKTTS
jgi:F0F1-type ATP synthase epsilon subunit